MKITRRVLAFVLSMHLIYTTKATTLLVKKVYGSGLLFEAPHWSVRENALYWVDTDQQKVHRLDWETGNVTTREIGYGAVSLVVTIKDSPGYVVVTVRTAVYIMPWDEFVNDSSLRILSTVDLGLPDNSCNDGKVDAKGRLWFGTMGKQVVSYVDKDRGSLYVLDEYNYLEPAVRVRPVSMSNGIAWTGDNKYMFYIDTPTRRVDMFDFNLEEGTISNRRTLFSFKANNVTGIPDGMTIDRDGNLWVACYDGGKVIKIDSKTGKLLDQYKLPVTKVTSVMWGGDDLATLYVTTSSVGLSAEELARQSEAGSLFAIEGTGSRGVPENQFLFPDACQY